MKKRKKERVRVLTEEDRAGLAVRSTLYDAQAERARVETQLTQMVAESYNAFLTELRERYEMDDNDEVDLATGAISVKQPTLEAVDG